MEATTYTPRFYEGHGPGSLSSARVVVPLLLELTGARSVVDVGCGIGEWLAVFREHGVEDIRGFDGDYVPRELLRIPEECFQPADLQQPLRIDRSFDLAMSVEVAEHLPYEHSAAFVEALVGLAPLVAFSAAIPLQGGNQHINERWQGEWAELFKERGYLACDAVRPRIWNDEHVEGWYRQNLLLYVREDRLVDHPALRAARERTHDGMLSLVHPYLLKRRNERPFGPIRPIAIERANNLARRTLLGPLVSLRRTLLGR